jgi:hypothetical protein
LGDIPAHGITLKGIREFIAAHGGREAFARKTTSAVCQDVVLPATRASGLSYCAQLLAAGSGEVGVANAFVSHAWGYKFLSVVNALEEWEASRRPARSGDAASGAAAGGGAALPGDDDDNDSGGTVFWFDLFANPQTKTADRPFEWWTGCFRDNIRRIGHTLLVLEWEDPKPLTRAWCVWEIACSIGTKLEVIMSPVQASRMEQSFLDEIDALQGVFKSTLCYADFAIMVENLCHVDVARAQASLPSDKEKIVVAIEKTVGLKGVNDSVSCELRSWLLVVGNAALSRVPQELRAESSLLRSVAKLLHSQGKFAEAEPLYREALEGRRRRLGPGDSATLTSLESLAGILQAQGKLAEAEPLYRKALEGRRRRHGPRDPATLTSLESLAGILQAQGKLAEAEPLYREALEGRNAMPAPPGRSEPFADELVSLSSMMDELDAIE